jgi:hypothetical protein
LRSVRKERKGLGRKGLERKERKLGRKAERIREPTSKKIEIMGFNFFPYTAQSFQRSGTN